MLAWEPQLEELGHLLDRDQFPDVFDGGFVAPGVAIDSFDAGEEKTNVSPRQKTGPTTRSWQRPEAWQGPPNSPAPIVRPDLQAFYEEDLAKVHAAYPGARVWREEDGLWLRTESALLQSAPRRAVFITAVPYSNNQVLRAWAFWDGFEWIGPRHTNFPDGSICAFEPADGTWRLGESLVPLLDIYTVWALRHFYRSKFGRWPGHQSVHHPYERLTEIGDNEWCGCGREPRALYSDCCKDKDLQVNRISVAVNFMLRTGGANRRPPDSVICFLRNSNKVPSIREILLT